MYGPVCRSYLQAAPFARTDVDWLRLAPQSLSFDSRFDVDEEPRGAAKLL